MNLHMFTLQRPLRILCADVFHKVNIKKNPTLADLRSWDLTCAHLHLQGHGVDVQELRGVLESERIHGNRTRRTEPANASASTLRNGLMASGSSVTETGPEAFALRRVRMINSPAAGRMASVSMENNLRTAPSRKI